MKIIIGIVFLCVLFFWFVVWLGGGFSARNEPPKQPDQSYQTIDAPKKYLAPLSTALTLGFNRLGTFIHDFREEIVAIGTLSIAAFTIILAFATAFLYEATRDLVKGAEETAERQLRAYLGVKSGSRIISHDGGNTFIVEIQIINSGQTPARRVTHSIAAELQVLHGPRLDFQMPPTQPGEWFMAPNTDCQSASKFDPPSASNFDPLERRIRAVALALSELVGIAETA